MKQTKVTNEDNREFNVVIRFPGDRYGATGSLVATRTLVEFYDATYEGEQFGDIGQFTGGRYHVEDIKGRGYGRLSMDLGVPAWTIDAETMEEVQNFLHAEVF